MKKILYIVLDGLGDLPIEELGNKTPLEAAAMPNLDKIAPYAKMGLVYTVGKDIAPESDVAVISILGYEADKFYTGRGPLESYAEGLEVLDGDLAYRVNFATKEEASNKILDRRVGRNLSTEEATILAKEINEKVKLESPPAKFIFKNTIGHRGVLLIRKKDGPLSAEVTNTDPAYEKEGPYGVAKLKFENIVLRCEPTPEFQNSIEAQDAAKLTNEFIERSSHVLSASEVNKKRAAAGKPQANAILTRDAGNRLPKFPKLAAVHGAHFGCFVEMPVERGIALLTGMEVLELPLASGDLAKDYTLRAERALESMVDFDCLYVHIKGPDEPAHDGDYEKKKKAIESIDKYFFGNLLPKVDLSETIIVVTADHSTPCKLKSHSADPVPLMLVAGKDNGDGFSGFDEGSSAKGSLGTLMGHELMALFMGLAK